MRRSSRRARIDEPLVLIGGVVQNEIHDYADLVRPRLMLERFKVLKRAVDRIDSLIVRDVVTEIDLWRRIARGKPDRIDAKVLQIAETPGDAGEIADAIAVAVGKAARVDFVEDRMLPPFVGMFRARLRGRQPHSQKNEDQQRYALKPL